uniref:MHD domain-containing protein n=1 Tax=Chromera velia CCMP2878 TaxID=1169474 RepID=A0A0G4G7Y4_9ALVE|mmetsp:Transcript_32935/g.65199  ORF Transcript_32935/g.65199 Transcript_32935/m.65199 type:complete len:467 (+) Transcript_32935:176-1576(+)|eukprot:Cvel_20686.t1-p1 / transcript=Cvel_20686.t1 / gene=Cvel_20686 / organism=Chromera_velia_CCMP2878 / gene_product=AP-4 complex subunit mu-1, putative / transcript_product=AP-4 complex subunit mu-1, putative / location=Cvel_scaffold1880:31167-34907(+) / protein_length=466 / sequence_SO=supercontig / SO=protein_coding / is_pseudo=false
MLSQVYILSPRGDTIINRDFRGDIFRGTAEIFFRKVKFWGGDAPPIFNVDGINYIFVKKNGLYFVCVTLQNVSPTYVVELLLRVTKLVKDFCGVLSEESIRKNFILVYEILDEVLDYGYPQMLSTENLKSRIHNEAIMVDSQGVGAAASATKTLANLALGTLGSQLPSFQGFNPKTVPSNAVHRPVGHSSAEAGPQGRKNEVFLDILERLTVVLNTSGYILNSCIDGTIQMKSYLTGNPELKLALNDDLVIGKHNFQGGGAYGVCVLDDCNFHECVDLRDFDGSRILSFVPPDGEFAVMNYRITSEFPAPFRIFPLMEETAPRKLEVVIRVRADIPEQNYGANVQVTCQLPKSTTAATVELLPAIPMAFADYNQSEQKLIWNIKKFQGGQELNLRSRVTLSSSAPPVASVKKDVGPVSLSFEIPMFNVSNLQVKYLKISERFRVGGMGPYRWVRYVTQSSSYICRF